MEDVVVNLFEKTISSRTDYAAAGPGLSGGGNPLAISRETASIRACLLELAKW
jgi:hypothetical protein